MASRDFIPRNPAAFAAWSANFAAQLPALAAKYKIDADTIAQVNDDNAWVQYWINAKFAAKQQEKQLRDFVEDVVDGKLGANSPSLPVWSLPGTIPKNVPPGIKKRYREVAATIKAPKSIYTKADGVLLGIVASEDSGLSESDYTPELKLHTLANFALETDFRLYGLDALRVEARRKNGEWMLVAFLTKSPGVFTIVPTTPNAAEQIEIRAVFVKNNQPYGNYSPIYTALIAP